jgi:biotin carboxyl carrier protein
VKLKLPGHASEFEVEVEPTESSDRCIRARIKGDGIEAAGSVETTSAGDRIVRIGRRAVRVFVAPQRGSILVASGPAQFTFIPVETRTSRRVTGLATPEITAPMPGKVVKLPVTEGQEVKPGDVLVVLEAMKMETALHAESPAIVQRILARVGEMVGHGALLLVLSPVPSRSAAEDDALAP